MKRLLLILTLVFTAALSLSFAACSAAGSEPKLSSGSFSFDPDDASIAYDDDAANFNFDFDSAAKTAELTGYVGNAEYVRIPAQVTHNGENYAVTSIGDGAFWSNPLETKVEPKYIKIPDGVTRIGESAFAFNTRLVAAHVPASVTEIGRAAWNGCTNLREITLPFVGRTPESFYDKNAAKQESHFGYVFGADGWRTQEAAIPAALERVTLVQSEQVQIPDYAFSYMRSVKEINLPEGILSIGEYSFFWCEGLETLKIPDSVITMGISAMNGCSHLVELTLPFSGMSASGTVGNIGYGFGAKSGDDNSRYMPSTLKKVTITRQTQIKSGAFKGLSNLNEIVLPDSLTDIGDGVFDGCTSLKYNYDGEVGYLGGPNKPYLIAMEVKDKTAVAEVVLSDTCIAMESYVFSLCPSLESVKIPEGVKKIGTGAFYRCESLVSATVPDSVTAIGESAFYHCDKLESVQISPDSELGSIGRYAFVECVSLKSVFLPDSLNTIGYSAFFGCESLKEVNLENLTAYMKVALANVYSSPFAYAERVTAGGVEFKELVVPSGVNKINEFAFANLKCITSVNIHSGVTAIGYSAFIGCSGIERMTVPFVGGAAAETENNCFGYIFGADFYEDNADFVPASLSNITVIGGTGIKANAFYGLSSLVTVSLPSSVSVIGERAFYGCTSLSDLSFSGSAEAFSSVTLGAEWNANTAISAVRCADGDFAV